jgi:hypothetical protein
VTEEVTPPALFVTNAVAVADITTDKDSDGILRRAKAFRLYRDWHPVFKQMETDPDFGVDLHKARVEPHQLVLPRLGNDAIKIPLDSDGNLTADFVGGKLPRGGRPKPSPSN